jgi:DNA-binding NarL/FixJ family response regulator
VDDHPLYRSGVQLTLARAIPDLTVLLAGSREEALQILFERTDIDLCLADLRLPGADGISLLETVGRQWPSVARGLLCSDPGQDLARRAREIGCVACLSKSRDMDGLAEALAALFDGAVVYDTDATLEHAPTLSSKRRLVLELAARGMSNKEIARELGITERTVKDHWASIFTRLGVGNRAEAVSRAHHMQLI